mmetsp:Transcript_20066/g.24042  ORF Transcript_20066/g.24042 Transcript_20066/m.24042 type:complete len:85 (+) Transcript_20066:344-598(+)
MSTGARRLSGLQIQVLKLYREIIRAARDKDTEVKTTVLSYARAEFEKNLTIDRKNTLKIEHLLRRGAKQLQTLQSPDFVGVNFR